MATLTPSAVLAAGTLEAPAAASGGGDKCPPLANSWVEVTNGGGSSITVTVPSYAAVRGQAAADRTVTIAAGATKKIPLYADLNTNPSDGLAAITYSGVTSVTVAAYRI